jgi:hypothetical protein
MLPGKGRGPLPQGGGCATSSREFPEANREDTVGQWGFSGIHPKFPVTNRELPMLKRELPLLKQELPTLNRELPC